MAHSEALPKGLLKKHFEKQALPKSREPPISFVPEDKEYVGRGSGRPDKVKIDVSPDVKKEFHVLHEGVMEDALRQIEIHRSLVKSKGFEDKLRQNVALASAKVNEYNKLKKKSNPDAQRLESLREACAELECARREIMQAPYDLMGELLGGRLKLVWEKACIEQCDEICKDLDGKPLQQKRGRTLSALEPCYTKFLCDFGPPDSFERTSVNMRTNIMINFDRTSPSAVVNRFDRMSGYLETMPCLKNLDDSPDDMPRGRKMNGYELCEAIKGSLTRELRASYDSIAQTEFECDKKQLVKDLEKAWEERNAQKAVMQKMIQRNLEEITGEYRIPKKDRAANKNNNKAGGSGTAGGDKPPARGSGKECERCAKWRPNSKAKLTHSTGQCRAFNADGSRKDGYRMREEGEVSGSYRKRYSNHISKGGEDRKMQSSKDREIHELKQKARKWEKRARHEHKKRGRSYRRSRRYDDDSSSRSFSSMSM